MKNLIFVSICLLCAIFSQAQVEKIDTIKVVMLISDTSSYTYEKQIWQSCEQAGCKEVHTNFITHFKTVKVTERNDKYRQCYWIYGYSVRRIHAEEEYTIGWFFDHKHLPEIFMVHQYYLDDKKKPIQKGLIVWQSVPAK